VVEVVLLLTSLQAEDVGDISEPAWGTLNHLITESGQSHSPSPCTSGDEKPGSVGQDKGGGVLLMGNAAFTSNAKIVNREEAMRSTQHAKVARMVHRIRSTVEAQASVTGEQQQQQQHNALAETVEVESRGRNSKKEWLPTAPCQCDPKNNHGRYSCHLQSLLFKDERRWCRAKKTATCRQQLVYCSSRFWFFNETQNHRIDEDVARQQKAKHAKEVKWKHRNHHHNAENAHKVWAAQAPLLAKVQVDMAKKIAKSRKKTDVYYDRMRGVATTHKDLHKAYESLSKKQAMLTPIYEQQNKMRAKELQLVKDTAKKKGIGAVDEMSALRVANQATHTLILDRIFISL